MKLQIMLCSNAVRVYSGSWSWPEILFKRPWLCRAYARRARKRTKQVRQRSRQVGRRHDWARLAQEYLDRNRRVNKVVAQQGSSVLP